VVCLLGPSGCGKSTALRLAAGLEPLQAGRVLIAGRVMADGRVDVPPENRGVGLVFQDFALFPHLTVFDNVAFGLIDRPKEERRRRVTELLERVALAGHADDHPHMLSGGQQQRVALARALAPSPRVMLMDEPFSGLDVRLRQTVRLESLDVLRAEGTTTLIVTHDPEEAMAVGDRIAVMAEGALRQIDTAEGIWNRPVDAFTATFPGEVAEFTATVADGVVTTPLGAFATDLADGAAARVLVRAEAIRVLPANGAGLGRATVRSVSFLGGVLLVRLDVPGVSGPLIARMPAGIGAPPTVDRPVMLTVDRAGVFVFRA
jgi:iron(III) transport system ATP-binding protein